MSLRTVRLSASSFVIGVLEKPGQHCDSRSRWNSPSCKLRYLYLQSLFFISLPIKWTINRELARYRSNVFLPDIQGDVLARSEIRDASHADKRDEISPARGISLS